MAQIFVSHSSRDTKQLDFLNKAFASTKVQAKYEEIEAIVQGNRSAAQIATDIAASNAIMVVLGSSVESLKHTRDWVAWESGAACGTNKDVWVIEALEDSPRLSVVTPRLQHYVCFQYADAWLAYLRSVVDSYDDSHYLTAAAAGAGVGAAMSAGVGAIVGAGVGLLMAANAKPRPAGSPFLCPNPQCRSSYNVHLHSRQRIMRCPVCNARLQLLVNQPAA